MSIKRPNNCGRRKGLMRRLYDIQEGRCAHCLKRMAHPDDVRELGFSLDPMAPTLDHFVPHSQGGPFVIWNLMLAHRDCNERRGDGPCPPEALPIHERIFALTYEAA